MPISQQELQEFWHSAAPGRLSPWQQARALGLRDASKDINGGHVHVSWIASLGLLVVACIWVVAAERTSA